MVDINKTLQFFAREDEERHAEERAKKLNLEYINLVGYPVSPEILALIPSDQALTNFAVSYLRVGNTVKVATSQPNNPALTKLFEQLKAATKYDYKITYCSETSIRYALSLYAVMVPKNTETDKVEVTKESQADFEEEIKTFEGLKEKITTVSTTEVLDVIFAGAMKNDASDVHLEPQEEYFRIRFRIDGVLQDVAELPKAAYAKILSRIKYLAKLKSCLVV